MFQWRNPLWEQLPLVSIFNLYLPRHKRCQQTWTIHSCQGKTKGMILSLPISPNRQPYSSHFVSYLSDTPCHSYLYFICVFHVSHSCNNTWMNFMLYYANTTNQDPLTSQTCRHLRGTLVILLCVPSHRYLALSSWRALQTHAESCSIPSYAHFWHMVIPRACKVLNTFAVSPQLLN